MIVAVSEALDGGHDEAKRKALALSLLTAVNLACRQRGFPGCTIVHASLSPGVADTQIMTITAGPGEEAATLDDVRAAFGKGGAA